MIQHERDGELHVVTLANGPNTIDPDWLAAMIAVLEAVEKDSEGPSGMVLTGEGKFFSSGLNVEVVMGLQGDAMTGFGAAMMEMMQRLVRLPVPTVAALNGHAFAAGAFLALACDFRVMRADKGWFCVSEVDVGVPIGHPMMGLLQARLSPQVARDAVLSGHRYPADEALAAGIVDAIADEASLLDTAKERARSLATKERRIFSTLKRQLNASVADAFVAGS